jgi:hypothetical protein
MHHHPILGNVDQNLADHEMVIVGETDADPRAVGQDTPHTFALKEEL